MLINISRLFLVEQKQLNIFIFYSVKNKQHLILWINFFKYFLMDFDM